MANCKRLLTVIAPVVLLILSIISIVVIVNMQGSIIDRFDSLSKDKVKLAANEFVSQGDAYFINHLYSVSGLRGYVESEFSLSRFSTEGDSYFDEIGPSIDTFVQNAMEINKEIQGMYFVMYPDLLGYTSLHESYFERASDGSTNRGPVTLYEEYEDTTAYNIEWFYGAFNSGQPYWVYYPEWGGFEKVVSYIEPVIVSGEIIGVVGMYISVEPLTRAVSSFSIYDSGYAVLVSVHGRFLVNDKNIIDSDTIRDLAWSIDDGVAEMKIDGNPYLVCKERFINDFTFITLVPMDDYQKQFSDIRTTIMLFPLAIVVVLLSSWFVGTRLMFKKKTVSVIDNYMESIVRARNEDADSEK